MKHILFLLLISCFLLNVKGGHDLTTFLNSSRSDFFCTETIVSPPLCKTEWLVQIRQDFKIEGEGPRLKKYLNGKDLDSVANLSEAAKKEVIRRRRIAHRRFSGLPETKGWVRRNVFILNKMVEYPTKHAEIVSFYATFTPNPKLPDGTASIYARYPCVMNGTQYNKYGFVKFKPEAVAPITFNKYVDQKLDGAANSSKYDYESAAAWFVEKNPATAKLAQGGQGIMVNGVYHAMHHMEDGRTMMPIRASSQYPDHHVAHTGGASLIRKGLQEVFPID
jgi:hypothetical protein